MVDVIRSHAKEEFPREACGLIVESGGERFVFRGQNIAERSYHFALSPRSYVEAARLGKIVGVYHSHPQGSQEPSQIDRTACNRSGLPWYVFSVPQDRLERIAPEDRGTPLLGRVFCWGVHDCFTLLRDYYRPLGVNIPEYDYEERYWLKGKDYYTERTLACGFVKVLDPEDIQIHDLLHMKIHADVPNHGAVYIGGQRMLHHLERRLSCRDVYDGFWKFSTSAIYRHPEARGEVRIA